MVDEQREPDNMGVLMIDFSPVVREGLKAILTQDERIKVIGHAPDEYEAVQHIKQGQAVKVMLT